MKNDFKNMLRVHGWSNFKVLTSNVKRGRTRLARSWKWGSWNSVMKLSISVLLKEEFSTSFFVCIWTKVDFWFSCLVCRCSICLKWNEDKENILASRYEHPEVLDTKLRKTISNLMNVMDTFLTIRSSLWTKLWTDVMVWWA